MNSDLNSTACSADSNCGEECPYYCNEWKSFDDNNCIPSCPWIVDPSITLKCGNDYIIT